MKHLNTGKIYLPVIVLIPVNYKTCRAQQRSAHIKENFKTMIRDGSRIQSSIISPSPRFSHLHSRNWRGNSSSDV